MLVYKVTNLINGKVYVGQDTYNRQNYYGSGMYIKRAVKKYEIKNFKKEILEYCISKEQLDKKEIYWIKRLNSKTPNGYNIIDGGGGILNPSAETREKMSIVRKGKTIKELGHKKNCQCGVCKAMRRELIGKNHPNYGKNFSKENNPFYGHKHTEETKKKMRKPKSEAHKKKLSEAKKDRKRKPFTEKHRENMCKSWTKKRREKAHKRMMGNRFNKYCK